jgi:hypothetical protein
MRSGARQPHGGRIVRTNVFTPFNGLTDHTPVHLLTGRWQRRLVRPVIVANSAIGIFRRFGRNGLSTGWRLNAPRAGVVQEQLGHRGRGRGRGRDDLLELRSAIRVLADGVVHESDGLEIDESR